MTDVPGANEGPGPAPMGQPTGPPASTAGLGARFGARLLDVLIIGIPASIVFSLAGIGGLGTFGMRGWISSAIVSVLWFGYYVYFESTTGATLGKKLLNLRVVAADGNPPSTEAAAKRNVWMLFGLVPILGDLASLVAVIVIAVTISSNEFNRGKHDEFAGTGVMA
jgi:uncharacterized RDD family membrane protein YckC